MVNEIKKFGQFVMCETMKRLDKFMMKFGQIVYVWMKLWNLGSLFMCEQIWIVWTHWTDWTDFWIDWTGFWIDFMCEQIEQILCEQVEHIFLWSLCEIWTDFVAIFWTDWTYFWTDFICEQVE